MTDRPAENGTERQRASWLAMDGRLLGAHDLSGSAAADCNNSMVAARAVQKCFFNLQAPGRAARPGVPPEVEHGLHV